MAIAKDPTGRFKDINWHLANTQSEIRSEANAQMSILMDIRDELKSLNALLHCANFVRIPRVLNNIKNNTKKPKRRKK